MNNYYKKNIVIPFIMIIIVPIISLWVITYFFNISSINLLLLTLEIKEELIISNIIQIIINIIIECIVFCMIYNSIRLYNSKREFLDIDIYGTDNYEIYKMAKFLGYKKISLIRKPYYIMFKIVLNNDFELVGLEKENENIKCEITVDESKFDNIKGNIVECNLIISDTYDIKSNQIPKEKRDISTIVINRTNDKGLRISSDELVKEVRKSVLKILDTGARINLYMTTSVYNTHQIINTCFKSGDRDNLNVNVYQQDDNGKRNFTKKYEDVIRSKK